MKLTNSFEVARPIDESWAVLIDVERIAPCLPGAQLEEVDGDDYRGTVKVKVGPITAKYKGVASFAEKCDGDFKLVLVAKGSDTKGTGNAEALITARLEQISDTTTRVVVDTDLKITGKVARFGQGVMADVSANLMDRFAENLHKMLAEGGADAEMLAGAEGPESEADADSGPRQVDSPEAEAVNLLGTAGTPVLKRALPIIGAIVVLLVLRRLLHRR